MSSKMYKRIFQIASGSHITGTANVPINKTTGTGIINGILIGSDADFATGDTITINYRDSKGSKPICQALPILIAGRLSDLDFSTGLPLRVAYVPVGCIALGGDAELDITINCVSGSVNKNVMVSGVLIQESAFTIMQHVSVTGQEINNKEISKLYITNASSYMSATIEIGFKSGRSEFVSVTELFYASELFSDGTTSSADVVLVYQNRSRFNEIEYVKCSSASVNFIYVSALVDSDKLALPMTVAVQNQIPVINAAAGNVVALNRKALQVESAYIKSIVAPMPASTL